MSRSLSCRNTQSTEGWARPGLAASYALPPRDASHRLQTLAIDYTPVHQQGDLGQFRLLPMPGVIEACNRGVVARSGTGIITRYRLMPGGRSGGIQHAPIGQDRFPGGARGLELPTLCCEIFDWAGWA